MAQGNSRATSSPLEIVLVDVGLEAQTGVFAEQRLADFEHRFGRRDRETRSHGEKQSSAAM